MCNNLLFSLFFKEINLQFCRPGPTETKVPQVHRAGANDTHRLRVCLLSWILARLFIFYRKSCMSPTWFEGFFHSFCWNLMRPMWFCLWYYWLVRLSLITVHIMCQPSSSIWISVVPVRCYGLKNTLYNIVLLHYYQTNNNTTEKYLSHDNPFNKKKN